MIKNELTIKFVAPLNAFIREPEYTKISIPKEVVDDLDGYQYSDFEDGNLVQYFADGADNPLLHFNPKFIDSNLSLKKIDSELYILATFRLNEALNDEEIKQLLDDTEGHFSDGAGQNFLIEVIQDKNFDFYFDCDFQQIKVWDDKTH